MMGGKIWAESELGNGATFIIKLPDVEVAAGETLVRQAAEIINYEVLSFEAATILIVDDLDYNREVLSAYLGGFGFNLYEAADGKDALAKVYKHQPDLILLDMKMPFMSGYDVCRELNNDAKVNDIPIVAVTASALIEDEKTISELCNGYLSKPVSKAQLIGEVMKYLKHEQSEMKEVISPHQEELEMKITREQLEELAKHYRGKI